MFCPEKAVILLYLTLSFYQEMEEERRKQRERESACANDVVRNVGWASELQSCVGRGEGPRSQDTQSLANLVSFRPELV